MNFLLLGTFVSLAFGGLIYMASENIFVSIIIFLFSMVFFVFLVRRQIDKYREKTRRYHQCYQFINTYLVSLSIKGSMSAARESSYNTADANTKEILDSIKDFDENEKLSYLCKYFKFDLYRLFLDTVSLWNEQGGDILSMSQHLVNQVRLKEEYILFCESTHRTRLVEFIVLWSLTLLILISLRFALSQFFTHIVKTIFYQVSVVVIFLFLILSIYVMVKRITNITLEGWKDDEK